MVCTRPFKLLTSIVAVTLAFALPALAEEPIIKLPATPAPSAGPTTAAAEEFCGEPTGKAEDLIARYSSKAGLQQVYTSDLYVAFSDDPKNATVMYTLTTKHNPAYPTAVCRKVVHQGDALTVQMKVVCDGKQEACAKLQNDFNVMTAKMQAEVDQQIAAGKK